MLRLTLKNIWAYKARLMLSMISIILGVAFLMGTFVISATLNRVFDDLFASVFQTTDAVVRSSDVTKGSFGEQNERAGVRKSIVEEIRSVDGVKRAEGNIQISNLIILDEEGERLFPASGGAPVLGFKFDADDILTQWRLVGENDQTLTAKQTVDFEIKYDHLIVDKSTFDAKNLAIGDELTVLFPDGPRKFIVDGAVRFGTSDGVGGAPTFLFNESQATILAQRGDTYDSVSVVAQDGISQKEIVEKLEKAFQGNGEPIQVVSGEQITKENQNTIKEGLSFFNYALTAFALIAFGVAIVIIVNSFAIIMTQRKREYALLRAVGAKASQIRRSVLLESFIVGLFASGVGVGAGIGLALLIKEGLSALGLELPSGPLVVENSSIAICILLGATATVLSAFIPALLSSRIPPIAALSDSAFEKKKRWWPRAMLSLISGLLFVVLLFLALSGRTESKIQSTGIALILGFVFVIFVIPFLVKPFTLLIGSRICGALLVPFGGRHAFLITGMIAKRNNFRNPRRTSRTALALVIGVALVSFVTVFAASVNATIDSYLKKNFVGDFIISSDNLEPIIPQETCDEIASQEFVKIASCFKSRNATYAISAKDRQNLNSANGTSVFGFDSKVIAELYATPFEGNLENLGSDGLAISQQFADDNDLKIGSKVLLRLDAGERDFNVEAILERGVPFDFASVMIDNVAYNELSSIQTATMSIVNLKDSVDFESAKADLEGLTKGIGLSVNDQKAIRDQNAAQIDQLLALIYGLLALAIVIASIGIVNTMSLSILERTKELGLVRAVGMLKSQVRGSIRFESVITAVMGTTIGIIFGVAGAYFLILALKEEGFNEFAVGVPNLISIIVLSAIIGVVAGAWPAWRATRIDILKAVSAE